LAAIEMIEAGWADQLVVAYFDRRVRSVQLEAIERVERAGGETFALDRSGDDSITHGSRAALSQPRLR
jgi:hypothetical protein